MSRVQRALNLLEVFVRLMKKAKNLHRQSGLRHWVFIHASQLIAEIKRLLNSRIARATCRKCGFGWLLRELETLHV